MAPTSEFETLLERRRFIGRAAAGTTIAVLGGIYALAPDRLTRAARAETRTDGRPRLPPGQKVLQALKPMGGAPGNPSPGALTLRIHGEVENPVQLSFEELLALPQVTREADVHCVTGWSLLGTTWTGVQLSELAELVKPTKMARHVIFEAAHGYTANVRIGEALRPNVMVAHRHRDEPLARPHGPPLRALVPDLYFWKSAKWLTGIRFVTRDQPGYWEVRGYNNHADPWLEERYA